MFASTLTIQLKSGAKSKFSEFALSVIPRLKDQTGIREYTVIDQGDDTSLVIVIYDSKEQWEAAAPKAREILGDLDSLVAAPPERVGGEVIVNCIY